MYSDNSFDRFLYLIAIQTLDRDEMLDKLTKHCIDYINFDYDPNIEINNKIELINTIEHLLKLCTMSNPYKKINRSKKIIVTKDIYFLIDQNKSILESSKRLTEVLLKKTLELYLYENIIQMKYFMNSFFRINILFPSKVKKQNIPYFHWNNNNTNFIRNSDELDEYINSLPNIISYSKL